VRQGFGANNAAAVAQALRVSIERALGDNAAVGIASAPGMIPGGGCIAETTRYIADGAKSHNHGHRSFIRCSG